MRPDALTAHCHSRRGGHGAQEGPPLGDFYVRQKREKGAGKALGATARKLLTSIFSMLKKHLDYWYSEERLYNKKLRVLQKAA
jgi:hypothetical protein